MAKDIFAIWQTCKDLLKQAEVCAKEGFNKAKSQMSNDLTASVNRATKEEDDDISSLAAFLNTNGSFEEMMKKDVKLTLQNIPGDILEGIKSTFSEIIEFVQLYLIQSKSSEDAFYGLMFINTDIGIDFTIDGLIGYNIKSKPYSINFNPFYAKSYSINELIGETEVELMRILQMHPVAFSKMNPNNDEDMHQHLENGSSVAATEAFLSSAYKSGKNNKSKINDSLLTRTDLEEKISDKTRQSVKSNSTIEYYTKISQAFIDPSKQLSGNGNGSGQGSSSMPGSSMPGDGNGQKPAHDWEGTDGDDVEEKLKESISSAYNSLSEKQRGELPSYMTEIIELLFKKPELNWKQILRKFVGSIPSGHRPSRMRLNRRQPERFDLKGTLPNKLVRLVVAIDTSGSMSNDDIAYCMNEIYNIVKIYRTDITVIECDADIGRIYKVTDPRDIKPNVTGRGGTSYIPVINYINDHKFQDSVMIYFTDGYGDCSIPRPRTYRNLWVIVGGEYLSLDEPYGEVKSLAKDKDYNN